MSALLREALDAFSSLPLAERVHVRARAFSAPLLELVKRVPTGRVLDVGCGHGLLSALLVAGDTERQVVGIDPDARKIRWAQAGPGRWPRLRFQAAQVEELVRSEAGGFDAAVAADVLYLLPEAEVASFLSSVHALLRPGGSFIVHEAEDDGGWRAFKWRMQERLMVQLLGRTRGRSGLFLRSRAQQLQQFAAAGFELKEVHSLAAGYSSPHVLFAAQKAS